MDKYIPDSLYNDIENKPKVSKILHSVPETSIVAAGIKTIYEAIAEIEALGEDKIANYLKQ